ncbi:MAG: hypothetical protein ACYC1P_14555 [Gaiellaceae bacterium]
MKLDPALKRRLKLEASLGLTSMSELTREALIAHLDRIEAGRRGGRLRGERLVERLRGRATSGLTTDEIMLLTRS